MSAGLSELLQTSWIVLQYSDCLNVHKGTTLDYQRLFEIADRKQCREIVAWSALGGKQPSAALLALRTSQCMGASADAEKCRVMIKEEEVLAALDKPRAIYSLQQRLDPSNKSTDALQELLMRMRTAGTVKFDIKTGKWRKA